MTIVILNLKKRKSRDYNTWKSNNLAGRLALCLDVNFELMCRKFNWNKPKIEEKQKFNLQK